jgi:hypothetical protein
MIDVMNANGALGHADGSLVSGGVFTIVSTPSVKNRAVGAGVYRGPLQYTFAGGDADGFIPGSINTVTPQVINPTSTEARVDALAPIRLGDSGQMICAGIVEGGTTPIIGVIGITEVADAGQDKVRAN